MPPRKRSNGQARKAKAAGRNVTLREKPSSEICEHGCVGLPSLAPTLCDMCIRFLETWDDTWVEETCEIGYSVTQAATKAMVATHESHPEVWNDEVD